jgi:hypothetical protein
MRAFDAEKVLLNVRQATTEDLLDRVTVYREGMELEAITIIERELRDRGVTPEEIDAHRERARQEVLMGPDGVAAKCSFCQRPAVTAGWTMHRLWGKIPLFPRHFRYCKDHAPQ